MKIASYNIENIFHRDRTLLEKTWKHSFRNWIDELESLIRKDAREMGDYGRMRELSLLLGFHKTGLQPYLVMRRRSGEFFVKEKAIIKEPRADVLNRFSGWIRLCTYPIPLQAIENKARVIREAHAEVLLLQEVEDRISLCEFVEKYLCDCGYEEVFYFDSNNDHGLGMGILLKKGCHLEAMKSHIAEKNRADEPLYDKDIQEFFISTPSGKRYCLINAHLQESGEDKEKDLFRRKDQVIRLAEIYENLLDLQVNNVIIAGTFNSPSYCDSLTPLLKETTLKDIVKHPSFSVSRDLGRGRNYHSLGAYRMGVNIKQKDYLLLSPDLFKKVMSSGLNRKGLWPETPGQWPVYSGLKTPGEMASHHPLLWCEIS